MNRYLGRSRFFTVLLSLWALLFAQAALASYACPGATQAIEVARMIEAQAPCAETMSRAIDDGQPSLCHAHCQTSQQSADIYQVPVLATQQQLGAVLSVQLPADGEADTRPIDWLRRDDGPPISIRNCCFRI